MKLYIYENHLGGLFCSDRELDFDEIYCEDCGDSDNLIGCADTAETAWQLLPTSAVKPPALAVGRKPLIFR